MSKESIFDKLPDNIKALVKEVSNAVKAVKTEMAATPTTEPVKMGEATLQDGTSIKYTGDTLAVGSDVTVITPEGETPAPDGELVLSDGSVVVISGGKVSEIKPPVPGADSELMNQEVKQVSERVTKIVEKFEAENKANQELIKKQSEEITALKTQLAETKKLIVDVHSVVEAFGSVETTEPVEKPNTLSLKKTKPLNFNHFKK